MLYKLNNTSLEKAPKSIEIEGTTYINNEDILKQNGYKPLIKDEHVENAFIISTSYTEDDENIYEHYTWSKYENVETPQEPTIEERLTETESNVTELQLALCDIYEGMNNNG